MNKIGITILYLLLAVSLVGCVDNSNTPKESETVTKKHDDIYVEKAVNGWPTNVFDESRIMQFYYPKLDLNGTLFEFAQEYNENSKDKLNLYRVELIGDVWKEVKIPWKNELNKKLHSKNIVIEDYCYTDKGILYLSLKEYSMYPKVYYNNKEKYQKEYYLIDEYLFRIDEKKGIVDRLNLPKLKAKDYYMSAKSKNGTYTGKDQIMSSIATILKNGNIFLASLDTSICGLYNGETCEKMADGLDISKIARCTAVGAGEDYFAMGVVNTQSNRIEVNVYGQDGQLRYTLPTDIEFDEEKFSAGGSQQVIVGVADSEILLASKEGIYTAGFGEEEFQMSVDVSKDRTYYLPSDNNLCSDSLVLKGRNDDFYLMIREQADYGMAKTHLCHYTRR